MEIILSSAFIKGVAVGVVLIALKVDTFSPRWWVAAIALNVMVNT